MPKTVEELEAELAALQAENTASKARITELNNESKGHRLNGDNFRTQAEKAAKEAADAKTALEAKSKEVDTEKARLEAEKTEALKASDAKIAEATTKAQQRAINADLKIAAQTAGAHDAGDVLALLDRSKIQVDDAGDIKNAGEMITDLKKAKPHLFGGGNTSNPAKPPGKTPPAAKHARDMTDEEFDQARKNRDWRK